MEVAVHFLKKRLKRKKKYVAPKANVKALKK
jgi:hypothetical protein